MMKQANLFNETWANPSDIVYTPDDVARDIVDHFSPSGKCLDPCRGDNAFYKYLPEGSLWCEIKDGKDFFDFNNTVDWIVSNPPYSIFADFLQHSLDIAKDIVYLIPTNKIFQSFRYWDMLRKWGGVREIFFIGGGRSIGLPFGFAVGAVHFQRNYTGGIGITYRQGL
jgi:hypothetical protein